MKKTVPLITVVAGLLAAAPDIAQAQIGGGVDVQYDCQSPEWEEYAACVLYHIENGPQPSDGPGWYCSGWKNTATLDYVAICGGKGVVMSPASCTAEFPWDVHLIEFFFCVRMNMDLGRTCTMYIDHPGFSFLFWPTLRANCLPSGVSLPI